MYAFSCCCFQGVLELHDGLWFLAAVPCQPHCLFVLELAGPWLSPLWTSHLHLSFHNQKSSFRSIPLQVFLTPYSHITSVEYLDLFRYVEDVFIQQVLKIFLVTFTVMELIGIHENKDLLEMGITKTDQRTLIKDNGFSGNWEKLVWVSLYRSLWWGKNCDQKAGCVSESKWILTRLLARENTKENGSICCYSEEVSDVH